LHRILSLLFSNRELTYFPFFLAPVRNALDVSITSPPCPPFQTRLAPFRLMRFCVNGPYMFHSFQRLHIKYSHSASPLFHIPEYCLIVYSWFTLTPPKSPGSHAFFRHCVVRDGLYSTFSIVFRSAELLIPLLSYYELQSVFSVFVFSAVNVPYSRSSQASLTRGKECVSSPPPFWFLPTVYAFLALFFILPVIEGIGLSLVSPFAG